VKVLCPVGTKNEAFVGGFREARVIANIKRRCYVNSEDDYDN
jgi:hypothetical protein